VLTLSIVGITLIVGTRVIIIALLVFSYALPIRTIIIHGTFLSVVARSGIVRVFALAGLFLTLIVGTIVIIVALDRFMNTSSFFANIDRTFFSVIARKGIVWIVFAVSRFGITLIVGTRVIIIAFLVGSLRTLPIGTNIIQGTIVSIVARSGIVRVFALAGRFLTLIVGTLVIIVAFVVISRLASSFVAIITDGTILAIVARTGFVVVFAFSGFLDTIIGGTLIIIVALVGGSFTHSIVANVVNGTFDFIVASGNNIFVVACSVVVAFILGTIIVIVTIVFSRTASSALAIIVLSTFVSIFAMIVVIRISAFAVRAANIVSTRIIVRTRSHAARGISRIPSPLSFKSLISKHPCSFRTDIGMEIDVHLGATSDWVQFRCDAL